MRAKEDLDCARFGRTCKELGGEPCDNCRERRRRAEARRKAWNAPRKSWRERVARAKQPRPAALPVELAPLEKKCLRCKRAISRPGLCGKCWARLMKARERTFR